MATTASPPQVGHDDVNVLHKVAWDTFERLLADDEGRRVPRMTYDQGVLELVTPSMPHEEDADLITDIVKGVARSLGIQYRSVRSTTFQRKDLERAFEPDASFYIQHVDHIRGKRQVNLMVDPPPDLVLEMEISRSAIDKLDLFASMGIPEVWLCDGQRFAIFVLEQGEYRDSLASNVLPCLTTDVLIEFLESSRTSPSLEWYQSVTDWAKSQRH